MVGSLQLGYIREAGWSEGHDTDGVGGWGMSNGWNYSNCFLQWMNNIYEWCFNNLLVHCNYINKKIRTAYTNYNLVIKGILFCVSNVWPIFFILTSNDILFAEPLLQVRHLVYLYKYFTLRYLPAFVNQVRFRKSASQASQVGCPVVCCIGTDPLLAPTQVSHSSQLWTTPTASQSQKARA